MKAKKPDVRSIKIQEKIRVNRYSTSKAPEIKLCGTWLEKLGFAAYKRVHITSMNKVLLLRVEE